MRLRSLKIRNVRGIRELDLDFAATSAVFLGSNGSGKSAIVDSIDFLLSGGIRRLEGAGTGGASLARHGAHVASDRDAMSVEGEFEVAGAAEPLRLRRRFVAGRALQCLGGDRTAVATVLEVCEHRAYVLTRRDLLRFITAKPQDRAEQVRALLDLHDVEGLRSASVAAATRARRNHAAAVTSVSHAEQRVANTLGLPRFDFDPSLAEVNALRASLGGSAVETLDSTDVKQSLQAPAAARVDVERDALSSALAHIQQRVSADALAAADSATRDLRAAVKALLAEDEARTLARQQRLVLAGIDILGDGSDCPLCDTPWPEGELRAHLEAKRDSAERDARLVDAVAEASGRLQGWVAGQGVHLERLVGAATERVAAEDKVILASFKTSLDQIERHLGTPEASDMFQEGVTDAVSATVAAAEVGEVVSRLIESLSVDDSTLQTAWDRLTRLEENLTERESAQEVMARRSVEDSRASAFRQAVLDAQATVLSGLYEGVQDRFAELYRQVHDPDEAEFRATLSVDDAGLGLRVPFYDQGDHVPCALHSEGHQDSMGLCLFLALFEALEEAPGFVVLDDVLMSIDRGHRKGVCQMLRSEFAGHQLILTTHDRNWSEQLRHAGVVRSAAAWRLKNWSLQAGSVVAVPPGMWERVEAALSDEDVAAASRGMRRGMEQFWQEVCEALDARVPLRMSAQWEFEQTFSAGMKRFKDLIRQARTVAERRGNAEKRDECAATLAAIGEIHEAIRVDRWMVNTTTHYNNWENLEPAEFAPIVAAFKRAGELLECTSCDARVGLLRAANRQEQLLACRCGAKSWPLVDA